MSKYSVKKPFTVLVAVILVLVLGVVSIMNMTTDLLPGISLPYLVVVTTYPGASPERVEADITKPLESALGTVNGVENVTSTSSENYSMVMLEFADDTNMDSAMVKVSTELNQLGDSLPDLAGTPMLMEISADMMATQYVAVDYDGMDIYQLSAYAQGEVIPALERVEGVADVQATGLVEKSVKVTLQQRMIDEVNDRLLVQVSERLDEAKTQLEEAQRELYTGQKELQNGQDQLDAGKAQLAAGQDALAQQQADTATQLAQASQQLDEAVAKVSALTVQMEMLETLQTTLGEQIAQLTGRDDLYEQLGAALAQLPENGLAHSMEALIAGGDQALAELQAWLAGQTAETALTGALQQLAGMTAAQLAELKQAHDQLQSLESQLAGLPAQLEELGKLKNEAETNMQALRDAYTQLEAGKINAAAGFGSGSAQLAAGATALESAQAQLDAGKEQLSAGEQQLADAWEEYESAREEALAQANLDQLLNMQTLAQILAAQNFSMPAGYIKDGDDTYLLKVGDSFSSVEELAGVLLCSMDGVGDVRLSDVATIEITDNADEAYAKVGGNQAVLLAIYKSSTASTSEVSDLCNKAMAGLMEEAAGLHLTSLMDQGDYIRLIVNNVMSNLIVGAILAVIVLALFLRDFRPTLVVAVSIPLSVLCAIVLMYFSGITLNMISLSGLALGIGMLVDNSIVVIENIYRLRSRGVPAARAAVQGARQVASAIISSTVTTICVFLPLIFTDGMTRELLMDMALTIAYSLIASLVVALTVVPCAGSTLLKKAAEKKHPLFDRIMDGYERLLRFCLRVKAVPLGLAVGLLVFCGWQLSQMGLVLLPNISSTQMTVQVQAPEDATDEQAFATADAVMERLVAVDGVETVGAMSSSAAAGIMGGLGGGSGSNGSFTFYMILTEEGARDQAAVQQAIADATADLDCTVSSSMGSATDMSALTGSGVEINVYGQDLDGLLAATEQISGMMATVPGITDISNGQEEGDREVRIVVDKDEATRLGLTVAQVYAELAKALTTESTSTALTVGAESYTVQIVDDTKTPELGDILQYEFTTTTMDETGAQASETHTLGEFAHRVDAAGVASITRENQARYMTVTSSTQDGYNTTLLSREVQEKLSALELPEGCTAEIAGETTQVQEMVVQMAGMMLLALILIYLVMVAQFQSLLSPFIVMFTIPLAFTGGMLGLLLTGETMNIMSLMGFLVLMGVVVNNGIVFVDYANQLRIGGLGRQDALAATGRTRMRPILMTTLTTILAMATMLFSADPGSEMGRGMAIVIVGGLLYATLMTLFVVPVLYDIMFRKPPVNVDVGDDGMDDLPDDAAEFAAAFAARGGKGSEADAQ